MGSRQEITRRNMLAMMTGPLVVPICPLTTSSGEPGRQNPSAEFDLLIKGGKVIDPSQNLEEERDVAIRDGKIVRLERDIPANRAHQVLNATGMIVTPGLIDVHVHVLPYVGETGTEPDPCCIGRGVTTAVDAGTAGAFTLPAL